MFFVCPQLLHVGGLRVDFFICNGLGVKQVVYVLIVLIIKEFLCHVFDG